MTFEIPEAVDPIPDEWWEPLLGVERLMQESPRLLDRCFRVEDFMLMGRERRRSRPLVYLYKHKDTRRYLNVDRQLRAYVFVAPRSGNSDGSYRRLQLEITNPQLKKQDLRLYYRQGYYAKTQ